MDSIYKASPASVNYRVDGPHHAVMTWMFFCSVVLLWHLPPMLWSPSFVLNLRV